MKKKPSAISEEFIRKRGIVLLTMLLGFVAALLHASLLPNFEIIAFLSFLGPLGLGAYGIRTYRATKEKENGDAEAERLGKVDPFMG